MKYATRIAALILLCTAVVAATAEKVGPLNVPYLSQFWAAKGKLPASPKNGNCAPASVEMAAAHAQNRQAKHENIVELNKLMAKKDPIKGGPTKHGEVCEAGKKLYKLPIEYKRMGLADALKEVAAGSPVVVGVAYKHLTTRWDQHFTGGHMLVIVGADDRSVIVNDPDDKRPGKGKNIRYDRAEFEKAMTEFGNRVLVGFRKPAEAPPAKEQ